MEFSCMIDFMGNRNLLDVWLERVCLTPEQTFLIYENDSREKEIYTFREFYEQVIRTANSFVDLGVQKGDRVVLQMNNCPETIMCIFGLSFIGGVAVILNCGYNLDDTVYAVNKSNACLYVSKEESLQMVLENVSLFKGVKQFVSLDRDKNSFEVINLYNMNINQTSELKELRNIGAEDDFEIVLTSGTTSRPKSVLMTHANAIFAGTVASYEFAIKPSDRVMITLPVFHVDFLYVGAMSALLNGSMLIMPCRFSASNYLRQACEYGATISLVVASMIKILLERNPTTLDENCGLKLIAYFMDLTDEERNEFQKRFKIPNLISTYGLSEALSSVTCEPVFGEKRCPSIGKPFPMWDLKIVDKNCNEVEIGKTGEIWIKGVPGRTLMKCYDGDPEATQSAVTADGWLKTGDLGFYDKDGYVYFSGRIKDMIKRKGENIAASEVEHVILSHPDIKSVAVIGVPEHICGEEVKAYVVLKDGAVLTAKDIIDWCCERMTLFKVPELVELCDSLPMTPTGKIDKKVLKSKIKLS
jgi:crotonobetaine/carnitine-CoA ligase